MNIATVLFTYNRSGHTEKVVKALSKNTVLPKKLYIFQDGLQKEEHRAEWEKVNELIQKIDFCPAERHVLEKNIGVAESIVAGIDYVLERHDAVIVLEDDCVPAVNFIHFMEKCFEKYKDNKRVWSVSGYSWPIDLEKDQYDVYGFGRTSSWGWGTWKDRWEKFSYDNNILKRLRSDEKKSRILAVWGEDCERMLLRNVAGRLDAWDIYWTLLVFENNGICINPYESLIQNIGLDGSGVHCGRNERFWVALTDEVRQDFMLPDDIDILPATEAAFSDLYGNYTALHKEDGHTESVMVYGLGNFFSCYEKEINEKYFIRAFIDKRKRGWFAGKKIISLSETAQYDYSKILIMVQDLQECIYVAEELIKNKMKAEQIILGHSMYGKYSREMKGISVLPDGGLLLSFAGASVKAGSKEEFDYAYKVFVNQIYHYDINNGRQDVVLDIGMHTSISALYFQKKSNVKKVYEYESGKEVFSEELRAVIRQHSDCNIVLKLDGEDTDSCLRKFSQKGILDGITAVMVQGQDKEMAAELLKEEGFSYYSADGSDGMGIIYAYRSGMNQKGRIR